MRVIQILGSLAFGDAIGNHAVALKRLLRGAEYQTELYAQAIDPRLSRGIARPLRQLRNLKEDDIIIYHMSSGCPLNMQLKQWKGRKLLMYHNITPPRFFQPYDTAAAAGLQHGLEQAGHLMNCVEYCVTMSKFSRQDLIEIGYSPAKIWVMPACLIPFEDYAQPPDEDMLKKYADEWANILFVGRLAPNKKQEDAIRAFAYYKKHIHRKARLFLVGSAAIPSYAGLLKRYVDALGVEDVIFPGHINFAQLIALYRSASVFLCMSEHEGFCVPLAEAMYFDVPVLAYCAAAVPETLGGSGVLLDSKEPPLTALWMDRLISDRPLREHILQGQRERLKQLMPDQVQRAFLDFLKEFV